MIKHSISIQPTILLMCCRSCFCSYCYFSPTLQQLQVYRTSCFFLYYLIFLSTMPLSVSLYPDTSRYLTYCKGANVTLACVTDTGTLRWSTPAGSKTFKNVDEFNHPISLGNNISVELTDVNARDNILTSELSIIGAPLTLNGSLITCQDNDKSSSTNKSITFHIPGNISSCRFAVNIQCLQTCIRIKQICCHRQLT